VTTLNDFGGVLGRHLDTFLSGSHNLMVTALGSLCVTWPLGWGDHCATPVSPLVFSQPGTGFEREVGFASS
jgi:hypothetical protein